MLTPSRPLAAEADIEHHVLDVAGLEIACSVWSPGPSSARIDRDLILVHGGAAQRQWWDWTAPLIRGVNRVIAIDLTGHGDSGRRSLYSLDAWSEELLAVSAQLCTGKPILVGHSLGGLICVDAAQRSPDKVGAVVALDTPLRRAQPENLVRRQRLAHRPVTAYATLDQAVTGYRPRPAAAASAEVIDHIARSAYRQTPQGWAPKYDQRIYLRPQVAQDYLEPAQVPTCWVRAERGLIDTETAAVIDGRLGPLGTFVEVSGAGHHLLLEHPLATAWMIDLFCASIETVLLRQ